MKRKNRNKRREKATKGASKRNYSKHHIIAKGATIKGSNHYENLVRLRNPIHEAIHRLFDVKLPMEQIIMLLHINKNALKQEFLFDIINVIEKHKDDYINDNCRR